MESKVGQLEASIDFIKTEVTVVRADVRDLRGRIEVVNDSLCTKLDVINREMWATRVWMLLVAGAILGVMAHGFKWL